MAITDAQIEAAALAPAEAESDGQRIKAQPLKDILEAQNQIAAASAISGNRSGWGVLRPGRVVLPAAVGPRNTETT